MLFEFLLGILALAVSTASSIDFLEQNRHSDCGTQTTLEDFQTVKFLYGLPDISRSEQNDIVIDTYMHIIRHFNETEPVTQQQIDMQFRRIVEVFKGTGFTFNLKNVTWTIDKKLSDIRNFNAIAQGRALRQGTYKH
ncbi:hypothetical protein VHEMI06616 [[Torrubiella] hemipterigena]|uniref:Uncharacterized protein n=1 Tax=[Torrubiella] hemipterigena TaxID=1531966 RepID=A0A0A1TJV7_9HYPO|nr:hypothetical protein VHEMI06616 [[Torrubiella] hemipterigena]